MIAKAGDELKAKARQVLAKLGLEQSYVDPQPPAARPTQGNWFCIDCGYKAGNNLLAQSHCIGKHCDHPSHRMGWFNWENNRVEEP